MSEDNRVKAVITAEDQASAVFDKVAKKSADSGAQVERVFGKIRQAASLAAAGIAAIGIAKFFGEVRQSINRADDMAKLAQKTGIATETLSVLGYQADLAGTSLDGVARGMKFLAQNIGEAQTKGGEAAETFRAINIDALALGRSGADLEQLLGTIADRFADMPDGVDKSNLAIKLFGKTGLDLIPILNEGSAGMAKAREEAIRFGQVVSTESSKAAEKFNDDLTRMNKAVSGFAKSVGEWTTGAGITDFFSSVFERADRGWASLSDAGTARLDAANKLRTELEVMRILKFKSLEDLRAFRRMEQEFGPDTEMASRYLSRGATGFYELQAQRAKEAAEELARAQHVLNMETAHHEAGMRNAAIAAAVYAQEMKLLAAEERRLDFGGGIRAGLDETRADLEDFFEQGRAMTREFLQDTNQDWRDLYFDVMEREVNGLGEFFGRFFGSMLRSLQNLAAQQAANATTSLLLSGLNLAFGGGASAIGGGGAGLGGGTDGAFGGDFEAPFPEPRALGGVARAGVAYEVNENRREIFIPDSDGRIEPRGPSGGGRGGNVSITIHAVDAPSFIRLAAENPEGILQVVVNAAGSNPSARNALRAALS